MQSLIHGSDRFDMSRSGSSDRRQAAVRQPEREQPPRHSRPAVLLQASIGALAVPPDSAEVVEAIARLKDLPIGAGDVVTGDAVFTCRPIIEAIRAKGA